MAKLRSFFGMVLMVVAVMLSSAVPAFAGESKYSTAPHPKPDGSKWRLGYLQGGEYERYQGVLRAIALQLAELGWWTPPGAVPQGLDAKSFWEWLAKNARSDSIEFVQDAFWSSDWDQTLRQKNKALILSRLRDKKDIDLMIAMGTWAAQDLANNEHHVPVEACSMSDPVAAGIFPSNDDSGWDHVHGQVDPGRYERQVRLFHEIIGFQRLGVAYEDTVVGRSYAALKDIEKVAGERRFEILRCFTQSDTKSIVEAEASVIQCAADLAPRIDAFYITNQGGVTERSLPKMLKKLYKFKVPTFAQGGSKDVRRGVLLSIAEADFRYVGRFHAESIAKILNGARPRDLDLVFEDPPRLALNLAAAQLIGWDPPLDVLTAADEIYQEMEE